MSNLTLFIICTLVWGSTWIAINYQLGDIHPVVSVAFRFCIAATCLGFLCWTKRLPLKLPLATHAKLASVGLAIYTLDYVLLYHAQQYLISAILALMSSCIIYFNVALRKLLLGKPVRPEVLAGATFGIIGMALLFWPEFSQMQQDQKIWLGIGLAMVSFICAALGNVISENILDRGTSVISMNFYAMSYSLIFTFGFAWLNDLPITLSLAPHYLLSLVYLAIFGSVIAFGAYMKLVQQIGSDKAAYVVLMYPIVALLLSTLFEGYRWSWMAFLGVLIVLIGNGIAMGKITFGKRAQKTAPTHPLETIEARRNQNARN